MFVLRLEDGDIIHKTIEAFAKEKKIISASVIVLGAVDKESILVTGPEKGRAETIVPKKIILDNVHEVSGTGTLFPDENGAVVLHMHLACGRGFSSVTGCIRNGVKVWHVLEVIIQELLDSSAVRKKDSVTGFELLVP
ncbi:MAG: DNA-binding protein [Desulfobacteraceae bacterium]|nr:DNA-binding protein [Desulfobacteraceae bacterium]